MTLFAVLPFPVLFAAVFCCGVLLGAVVNWAIYRLAWRQREISPWGPSPAKAPRRKSFDRVPILGWLSLRREASIHGRGFWIRPLAIELGMGIGLAALFWWEVHERGLLIEQLHQQLIFVLGVPVAVHPTAIPFSSLWPTFLSHVILITFMAAASFIDLDEKIIPDEITVPGTLLGLILAASLPMCLLPQVGVRDASPLLGMQIELPQAALGISAYVEPVSLAAPNLPSDMVAGFPQWKSLLLGQACWWLWCFALAPRIWRGRRGFIQTALVILRRVCRELGRPPLGPIAFVGAVGITTVWWWGRGAWVGLLSALIGLAVSCGLVWIVRLVGTAALKREAMGFGDVTLMMMVGTYLGWQACVLAFFIAPFAGLVGGLIQAVTKHDDVIPYGPFLCLGVLVVIVQWASLWNLDVRFVFQVPWYVSTVLAVCFVLLGIILAIWQQIKIRLFG